jgi:hypothetical protein
MMVIPPQVLALARAFKNPLWPALIGLILLAKKSPGSLHSAVDYLATWGGFLMDPENAAGVALVASAALWYTKIHGNSNGALSAAIERALAEREAAASEEKTTAVREP